MSNKRLKHYLIFVFLPLCLLFIVFSFITHNQSLIQVQILTLICFSYLIIHFIHHYLDKSLTFEIMIEYILIASLVTIVLVSMQT